MGNTEADNANELLKNAAIAVPLQYLSNFWRSLEMSLINYKVELKFKWAKYYVLSAAGAENINNTNCNNVVFYQRFKIICSCCNFISKRESKIIKTT